MKNLLPHFIQEQYLKQEYEGRFDALTMFVDVSGFTPLTQALMQEGHEGAEILALVLNRMFEPMVDLVYHHGGFISGFAGDALTAIFPTASSELSDEALALHVLTCAAKIQVLFQEKGLQETHYGTFPLRVKVGLSGGDVRWGDCRTRRESVLFPGRGDRWLCGL